MRAHRAISHSPLPLEGVVTVVPSSLDSYAETEREDTCHQLSRHKGQGMNARDKGKREALSPAAKAQNLRTPPHTPLKKPKLYLHQGAISSASLISDLVYVPEKLLEGSHH